MPVTASAKQPPRYWKTVISRITGLNFCDRSCPCEENNQLWWFPTPPDWANGVDTFELWEWMVENDRAGPLKAPRSRSAARRGRSGPRASR
jgi:hypothetical protein